MDWQIQHRLHPLKVPVVASHGTVKSRLLLILKISDGVFEGWGEAAPVDGYSEATFDECEQSLRACLDGLAACDPDDPNSTLRSLAYPLPSNARAALESALLDLAAKRKGVSVLDLMGGSGQGGIALRALLAGSDPAVLRDQADDAVQEGFSSFKLKLGRDSDYNLRATKTVREAVGNDAHISGDANASWDADFARSEIRSLSGQLDLLEQPVEGVNGVRSLRTAELSLALDEAATNHEALDSPAPADAICIKVQAFGGINLAVDAAAKARAAGMQVLVGSTLEGAVGMAASLVAAQLIQPDLASGLSTLDLFDDSFPAFRLDPTNALAPIGLGLGTDPDGTPTG